VHNAGVAAATQWHATNAHHRAYCNAHHRAYCNVNGRYVACVCIANWRPRDDHHLYRLPSSCQINPSVEPLPPPSSRRLAAPASVLLPLLLLLLL
jgi:hypothetical protein